jgi:ABC-2 type transport system permease protein
VINAFLFLLSRSFANRTKARLKRLKKPKYLIGAIFGFIYLYAYFFQFIFFGRRRGTGTGGFELDESIFPLIGMVMLFVTVLSAWIFPRARAALVFSEAEIAFLFPAPVSRRTLIHFKLLRSQVAILFTVLLLTLLTGKLFVNSQAWMRMLGWWVILSTLGLHFLGASFARTLLMERGISTWTRRIAVLVTLAALVTLTVVWAQKSLPVPAMENVADWKAWRDYARTLFATPPLSYLLFPFQIVLAPYFASTPLEFGQAMLPALGVIALHYLWVIRSNVAFEEASLELSRRIAERVASVREGKSLGAKPQKGQRAPFRLSPCGPAPFAFLWKNLINARASFRARTLLIVLIPVIVFGATMGGAGARSMAVVNAASMLLLMLFFWSLLIGSQFVRCDFRQDLGAMDVLKLYPLRGWQVVAGELCAPLVILTVVQWLLVITIGVFTTVGGTGMLPRLPIEWLAATAIIAPFWNGLALLIPNAAVLMFPGWFQTRVDTPQGIEVAGQRLLLLFGQMIVIGVAVLPAGLAFALGFAPLQMAGAGVWAAFAGAAAASIALGAEIVLGIWLVGKLFDRFDLAAEQGG